QGDGDWVAAFDVTNGKELWRVRLDDTHKGADGSHDGPLSSPVIADGAVYAVSPRGYLISLNLANGKERWRKRLDTDFGGKKPDFGFTTTPLVAGDVVVVQAGGPGGRAIVALDPRDGKTVWAHGDATVDYQSPALMTLAGRAQVVAINGAGITAFAPDTGKILWDYSYGENDSSRSATPVFVGEDRFLVSISGEVAVFRVSKGADGFAVEELYRSNALGNSYAPPVYHDGHIYGYRGNILTCVKAEDGSRVWRSREPGGDGLILVDEHLVIFGGLGNVVVAAATPDGYQENARFQALDGSSLTWPSFAGGRVFVRNLEEMAAVTVTDKAVRLPETLIPADLEFSKWLGRAEAADDPAPLLEELLAANETMPIVEGEFVTFVYRGAAEDVAVQGTMLENGVSQPLQRLEGTDLFYRTYRLDPTARWEYRFQVDYTDWVTDPLNPRTAPQYDGEETVSEFTMPEYDSGVVIIDAAEGGGTTETFTLQSKILEREKEITVWLPPGYADSDDSYPVLVVNDGSAWIDKGLMINTLDNLVGETVAPVVVAFVKAYEPWWEEVGDSSIDSYLRMQAEELMPALHERYRLSEDAGDHATMGNGFYGPPSILVAMQHPEIFGRVGVQSVYTSGSTLRALETLLGTSSEPTVRFYIDWNRYDERNVDRDWDFGRDSANLTTLLGQSGYEVIGGEQADSVGWGGWRARTDDLLVALFPAE
ncbi:MAG: PQQ-binding-like beta-propeller repeat protein, partial [Acidobacteriota bacterium]|nr:PQQ-binding-like beta-propeller repeat protein [Acidobacteriota bacterium]